MAKGFRVEIYAKGAIVRSKPFTAHNRAANYYVEQKREFETEQGISIFFSKNDRYEGWLVLECIRF